MSNENTEKLTKQFNELKEAIRAFVRACPNFKDDLQYATEVGRKLAQVESTLHHDFGCWELGLPHE